MSATQPLLQLASRLVTPLLPEDYAELINPLWTTRGLRARVEQVTPETADSASLTLRPGPGWQGHRAGQFVRVGVDVDGVRHWRCYSLSSAPEQSRGRLRITVKAIPGGRVSQHLVHAITPGSVLELSQAQGEFTWPAAMPERALFITGGSGITPVMAMLQSAAARGTLPATTLLHYAPRTDEVILGPALRALAAAQPQLNLQLIHTREGGAHFHPAQLQGLCHDWRERATWSCGPEALLSAVEQHWQAADLAARLTVERFRARTATASADAQGGNIRFTRSGVQAAGAAQESILDRAEQAGLAPAHGCRMGICHGCTARLACGQVRDLRTGQVHGEADDLIQICVSAPAGDIEIEL
jgi:stearoyl-CoA 9-desaturase NADPH oxidoreductase